MKNDKAVAVQTVPSLQQMVKQETKNRAILTQYIANHMKEGTDYGKIHFSSNCANKYNTRDCKIASHWSKDCLFKPGSEKFASLMKLVPRFKKDTDTWEMAGSKAGLFAYVCELVNPKGEVMGEGRGAADISEKNWTYNNAIKIAQKRAQIDAVLRTGGLSDFFTQDLEDMDVKAPTKELKPLSPREMAEKKEISYLATTKQVGYISGLLKEKGYTKEQLMQKYEVTELHQLTGDQASTIIGNLQKLPSAAIKVEDFTETDVEEADKAING